MLIMGQPGALPGVGKCAPTVCGNAYSPIWETGARCFMREGQSQGCFFRNACNSACVGMLDCAPRRVQASAPAAFASRKALDIAKPLPRPATSTPQNVS